MKKEINFLVGQRASLKKKAEISRIAKTGSFIVLIAYCLVVGVVFSYYFYLNYKFGLILAKVFKKILVASGTSRTDVIRRLPKANLKFNLSPQKTIKIMLYIINIFILIKTFYANRFK